MLVNSIYLVKVYIYMVCLRNTFNCCSQSWLRISLLNPVTSQEQSQNALSIGN